MRILKLLATVRNELPRVLPLMRDGNVPLWAKMLAALAAVLVISPVDLLGDIPFLGFFDDAALLLFVVHTFVRFAEKRSAATPPSMIVVS